MNPCQSPNCEEPPLIDGACYDHALACPTCHQPCTDVEDHAGGCPVTQWSCSYCDASQATCESVSGQCCAGCFYNADAHQPPKRFHPAQTPPQSSSPSTPVLNAIKGALREQMIQPNGSRWYDVTADKVLIALHEAGYSLVLAPRQTPASSAVPASSGKGSSRAVGDV